MFNALFSAIHKSYHPTTLRALAKAAKGSSNVNTKVYIKRILGACNYRRRYLRRQGIE